VVESRLLYALVVPQEQDHLYLHRALLQSSYFHKLTDFVFCALQWQWTVLHGYDTNSLIGKTQHGTYDLVSVQRLSFQEQKKWCIYIRTRNCAVCPRYHQLKLAIAGALLVYRKRRELNFVVRFDC